MSVESSTVSLALTAGAYVRTGFSFQDWNTASDGSGTPYANGAVYSFTTSVTLYAQWTPFAASNTTVKFNANGGAGFMKSESARGPTALSPNHLKRSTYKFAGWNTTRRGTGVAYSNGATFTFTTSVILYAQWTPLAPHATRIVGAVTAGSSQDVTIFGRGLIGTKKVTSDAPGTRVRLVQVRNAEVTVRISVKKGTHRGTHSLIVRLRNGTWCTISYLSR